MKLTVVSSNLSGNCLGRALILADVLALDHEVELVGTMFGDEIWAPARAQRDRLTVLPGSRWPRYARTWADLVRQIQGDVAIAVKPQVASFGAALAARARHGIPVLVDMDDFETGLRPIPLNPVAMVAELMDPEGAFTRPILERLVDRADASTVASRTLQDEFGGELVWHAKDTERLRPDPVGRERWRSIWGVEREQIVMFLGTPRPWKGLEYAARAVARLSIPATLAVVGADDSPYSLRLAAMPGVRAIPPTPLAALPGVLSAADVVVIPQVDNPITRVQMPSKLFDAMALARPVVATAVSDIPFVLADGRGAVVPAGNVDAMAAAIEELLADPGRRDSMGRKARSWCEAHASLEAARAPLHRALERALSRSGAGS